MSQSDTSTTEIVWRKSNIILSLYDLVQTRPDLPLIQRFAKYTDNKPLFATIEGYCEGYAYYSFDGAKAFHALWQSFVSEYNLNITDNDFDEYSLFDITDIFYWYYNLTNGLVVAPYEYGEVAQKS